MNKKWILKPLPDTIEVERLQREINVNATLSTLLLQRGIQNFDEAKKFFRPNLNELHDPFLMKDMAKAVSRILEAIKVHEKIMVYGDYDVDGTTAVTLFYNFLCEIHTSVIFYIPDRYKEGYGISQAGIDKAKEEGCKLIVALDCGIKSVELVDYATSLGIDFIICDHHLPGNKVPQAAAVLDPKQVDCPYPYKELSGCGIGFKLLQAIADQITDIDIDTNSYLDLVAVSIAADIVPITGENRTLAYYGLKQINENPRPGLQALLNDKKYQSVADITALVFGIAPKINAAGRIAHAHAAVELLRTEQISDIAPMLSEINKLNDTRKEKDKDITEQALMMIEASDQKIIKKSTVLYDENWHKGVVGIVASRCIEHYYRPTIILTKSENKIAGSARSVHDFDIYKALEACSHLLDQFGGHKYAAGLTLAEDNLDPFIQHFEEVVSQQIQSHQLQPIIEVDAPIQLSDITPKFVSVLMQMAPFGPGNMRPVFYTSGLELVGSVRILKDAHLKFNVMQSDSHSFSCIAFGMAHRENELSSGKPFTLAFAVEINEFKNQKSIQLNIKDIRMD